MGTTVKVQPVTVTRVDEHEDVARHTRRLAELEGQWLATRERLGSLIGEREQLRVEQQEAAIAAAAGDAPAITVDHAARLQELDVTIGRLTTEESTLGLALERLRSRATEIRARVQADIDENANRQIRELLAPMMATVQKLVDSHSHVLALANRRQKQDPFVPDPALLLMWLDGARKFGV
jgi:hypothetical protein